MSTINRRPVLAALALALGGLLPVAPRSARAGEGAAAMSQDANGMPESSIYQTQAALLFRSLTYLRSVEHRGLPRVLVAVLHGESAMGRRASKGLLEALDVFKGQKVRGTPFATVDVVFSNGEALQHFVQEQHPVAVIIGEDLQDSLPQVLEVTHKQKLLSMSDSEQFAGAGVSINAIALDGKPRLLLNVAGSVAEDQKFAAEFMQLVRLTK